MDLHCPSQKIELVDTNTLHKTLYGFRALKGVIPVKLKEIFKTLSKWREKPLFQDPEHLIITTTQSLSIIQGGEAEDDTNADADDEADDVEAPLFSRYHRQSRLRLSTHAKIDHFLFNLGPNIFEKAEHDAHAGATLRTRLDGTDKTRHCLGGGQKADNKDKLEEDKGMSRANALR
ncbi:hypothetical protein R3P38DRAFT_2771980 [Favolaschia claudopus]|uniref:Uncharacterized protein n=1 Tax=Favolaschia claudopus TaxID=2862362 RepID=A0AAW0C6V6_9AGAR